MKHLKTFLVALCIFSFLSLQQSNSIAGKWEVYKIETENSDVEQSNGKWLHFMNDGILKGGNASNVVDRIGNWSFNAQTNEVTISSKKKISDEGTFKITWVSTKSIYINAEDGKKIHLRRIE